MPYGDYLSSPAQVRAMIQTVKALGLQPTGVVIPAPAKGGPWLDQDPVNLETEPENAMSAYALVFGPEGTDDFNVAALRRIASIQGFNSFMRARELYGTIKGFMGLDEFRGYLERLPALEGAFEEKLAAILEGR